MGHPPNAIVGDAYGKQTVKHPDQDKVNPAVEEAFNKPEKSRKEAQGEPTHADVAFDNPEKSRKEKDDQSYVDKAFDTGAKGT